MLNADTYNVALFGISRRDERMINIVLSHQKSDSTHFIPVNPSNRTACKVGVIDLDAQNAHDARLQLSNLQRETPDIKVIYLSNDGQRGDGLYRIAHKSLLSQLVLTLQDIAKTLVTHSSVSALDTGAASNRTCHAPAHDRQSTGFQAKQSHAVSEPNPYIRRQPTNDVSFGRYGAAPLHALVVDDSVTVRNQLEAALKKAGFIADLASSGDQVSVMMAKKCYDIVFLDVVLPGDDGYSICKAIRKMPNGKSQQIVMLTSRSSPFDRARGALAGCNVYLAKPIALDSFYAAVDKLIMKVCDNNRPMALARGYQLSA